MHATCNLQLKVYENLHVPVIFHNGTGYDSHIVMQGLGALEGKYKPRLSCIPKNFEKYLSY